MSQQRPREPGRYAELPSQRRHKPPPAPQMAIDPRIVSPPAQRPSPAQSSPSSAPRVASAPQTYSQRHTTSHNRYPQNRAPMQAYPNANPPSPTFVHSPAAPHANALGYASAHPISFSQPVYTPHASTSHDYQYPPANARVYQNAQLQAQNAYNPAQNVYPSAQNAYNPAQSIPYQPRQSYISHTQRPPQSYASQRVSPHAQTRLPSPYMTQPSSQGPSFGTGIDSAQRAYTPQRTVHGSLPADENTYSYSAAYAQPSPLHPAQYPAQYYRPAQPQSHHLASASSVPPQAYLSNAPHHPQADNLPYSQTAATPSSVDVDILADYQAALPDYVHPPLQPPPELSDPLDVPGRSRASSAAHRPHLTIETDHRRRRAGTGDLSVRRRELPALESTLASYVRDRIPRRNVEKGAIVHPQSFTGKDVVDLLRSDMDIPRDLALQIARSLAQSLWFYEVDWDSKALDDDIDQPCVYTFSSGEHLLTGKDALGVPTSVYPTLTSCYSPTCTIDRRRKSQGPVYACYSVSCTVCRGPNAAQRLGVHSPPVLEQVISKPLSWIEIEMNTQHDAEPRDLLEAALDSGNADLTSSQTPENWDLAVNDPALVASLDKHEAQRQRLMYELIQGEHAYFQDLVFIEREFENKVKGIVPNTKAFLNKVLLNLDDIRRLSLKFLDELILRQNTQMPILSGLGDLALNAFVDWRSSYVHYAMFFPRAEKALLIERERNPRLNELILSIPRLPLSQRRDFDTFHSRPIFRLLRYTLILEQILKVSDPKSQDFACLNEAILILKGISAEANAGLSQVRLQNRLNHFASLTKNTLSDDPRAPLFGNSGLLGFDRPHRNLLHMGRVWYALRSSPGPNREWVDCSLVLFDHCLLFVKGLSIEPDPAELTGKPNLNAQSDHVSHSNLTSKPERKGSAAEFSQIPGHNFSFLRKPIPLCLIDLKNSSFDGNSFPFTFSSSVFTLGANKLQLHPIYLALTDGSSIAFALESAPVRQFWTAYLSATISSNQQFMHDTEPFQLSRLGDIQLHDASLSIATPFNDAFDHKDDQKSLSSSTSGALRSSPSQRNRFNHLHSLTPATPASAATSSLGKVISSAASNISERHHQRRQQFHDWIHGDASSPASFNRADKGQDTLDEHTFTPSDDESLEKGSLTFNDHLDASSLSSVKARPACSAPLITRSKDELILLGCSSGLYVGFKSDTASLQHVLHLPNIESLQVCHELGLIFVVSGKVLYAYTIQGLIQGADLPPPGGHLPYRFNTPAQRLSGHDDALYVRMGPIRDITDFDAARKTRATPKWVVVYLRKISHRKSVFCALEPNLPFIDESVAQDADSGNWFRVFRDFFVPTGATSIQLGSNQIAAICGIRAHIVDMSDFSQYRRFPSFSLTRGDPLVAIIIRALENCRLLSFYRVSQKDFILCYNRLAFHVDDLGQPIISRLPSTIEFIFDVHTVLFESPYVIAVSESHVEVWHSHTGALHQIIYAPDVVCTYRGKSSLFFDNLNPPENSYGSNPQFAVSEVDVITLYEMKSRM